jgi:hypothetical protein
MLVSSPRTQELQQAPEYQGCPGGEKDQRHGPEALALKKLRGSSSREIGKLIAQRNAANAIRQVTRAETQTRGQGQQVTYQESIDHPFRHRPAVHIVLDRLQHETPGDEEQNDRHHAERAGGMVQKGSLEDDFEKAQAVFADP